VCVSMCEITIFQAGVSKWRHDTQHNDIKHNDTQYNAIQHNAEHNATHYMNTKHYD